MPNDLDVVTKEFILTNTTQEDIFERYLGIYPSLDGRYTNPLREDDKPDCFFYYSKRTGMLKFKDFAAGYDWDCFNIVQIQYNCSFKKALLIIAADFNLLNIDVIDRTSISQLKEQPIVKQPPISYRVKRKSFTKKDLEYWASYGVSVETLIKFDVAAVQTIWRTRNGVTWVTYNYNPSDPAYVYWYGEYNYKFYFPFRPHGSVRFLQASADILQGYNQLPDRGKYLVITKSQKDVMSMNKFSIPAIAPMSETIAKGLDAKMPELKERFDDIFVLMDWDRTGKLFSLYMRRKWDAEIISFKSLKPKDFSDHYKTYGEDYMKKLIEDAKDSLGVVG